MGNLYNRLIRKKRRQKFKKGILININSDTVSNRNIDARTFLLELRSFTLLDKINYYIINKAIYFIK